MAPQNRVDGAKRVVALCQVGAFYSHIQKGYCAQVLSAGDKQTVVIKEGRNGKVFPAEKCPIRFYIENISIEQVCGWEHKLNLLHRKQLYNSQAIVKDYLTKNA